ncbi:HPF/RaiA family ribosome-associated protein [Candidatus Peregrinibacteria bacterium]|nr:MAG: HPF/RaiA family ribosome-associated protein [Candidatus Peregrinibacteria bacterium]
MPIAIHAKNFTLPENIKEKVEEKCEKLMHLSRDFFDESSSIRVEFELISKEKNLFHGTVTITLPGDTLRAEDTEKQNLLSIMDELEKEIRPQIERHKAKHQK